MAEGGSKQKLVSLKEFTENFAIPNKYGHRDSFKSWPHTTILLYKYSSNATKKKTTEDTCKKIQNTKGGDHAEVKMIKKLKKIQKKYGHRDSFKSWPHTTILLYKYSSNATKKKTTEDTWKKIQNTKGGDHAEVKMIKKLKKIQKELKKKSNGIHSIEVIQSYSPCSKCSKKLCDLMVDLNKDIIESDTSGSSIEIIESTSDTSDSSIEIIESKSDTSDSSIEIIKSNSDTSDATLGMYTLRLDEKYKKDRLNKNDEKVAKINFKITFSNFYKHYHSENREGLKDLLVNEIELDILTGDDKWKHFFDVVGLARETKLPEGRKEREKKDIEFFQELSGSIINSNDLDKK